MKKYLPFISYWILNSILLRLATAIRPLNFELGNFWLSPVAATLWAGFWMTLIVWYAKSFSTRLSFKLDGRATMFAFYWLANSAAIWLAARFAAITGFGISRFYWAIGLGLVASISQWVPWQGLKNVKQ